jgi:hypothetical protein
MEMEQISFVMVMFILANTNLENQMGMGSISGEMEILILECSITV